MHTTGSLYIATLSSSDSVAAVSKVEDVPAGCAVTIVNEQCSVYLMLKGILNPADELKKLAKRQTECAKQHAELQKKLAMPTYAVSALC